MEFVSNLFVGFLVFAVASVAMAPMFLAGVAFTKGAMLWGLYPIGALLWQHLIYSKAKELLSRDPDDEESS